MKNSLSMGLCVITALWLSSIPPAHGHQSPYEAGDDHYRHRAVESRARLALQGYQDLVAKTPEDPEAQWRLSMASYFVGLRYPASAEEKERIFRSGRDAGQRGFQLKESCAPCHFWYAINAALYGQTVGVFKMAFSLNEIRDHLKRVTELDPAYAWGGAYRLLGLIEQKLPGILGGSNDRARTYFEKAIAVAPDEPLNFVFLAKLESDAFSDSQGALKTLSRASALSALDYSDRLESREALSEAKELAQRIKNRAGPR